MINIGDMSYEDWVSFTFDHSVTDEPWHFEDENEYICTDSERLVKYLIALFESPLPRLNCYTAAQLDQGFWFISGPNGYLWSWLDRKIDPKVRVASVDAVTNLYLNLFNVKIIGSAPYMWWDSILIYTVFAQNTIIEDRDIFNAVSYGVENCLRGSSEVMLSAGRIGAKRFLKILMEIRDNRAEILRDKFLKFGVVGDL